MARIGAGDAIERVDGSWTLRTPAGAAAAGNKARAAGAYRPAMGRVGRDGNAIERVAGAAREELRPGTQTDDTAARVGESLDGDLARRVDARRRVGIPCCGVGGASDGAATTVWYEQNVVVGGRQLTGFEVLEALPTDAVPVSRFCRSRP